MQADAGLQFIGVVFLSFRRLNNWKVIDNYALSLDKTTWRIEDTLTQLREASAPPPLQ